MTALWTDAPPPPEYTDLILCRDVFHCLPSQLDEEDADRIIEALACLSAEAAVQKARTKR